MHLKATAVTANDIFPVVVAIRFDECNARVVWFMLDLGALARPDVVCQKPLDLHHCFWVIRLPHGEVVLQLDFLGPCTVRCLPVG